MTSYSPLKFSSLLPFACSLLLPLAILGCSAFPTSDDGPEPYVSKTELLLNVDAIADPAIRAQAQSAEKDIERTLLTLQDGRLDQAGVARALAWHETAPLLLPPIWRNKTERDIANGSPDQRFPMPFRRAENWSLGQDGSLSLVAVYSIGDIRPEVFERQTYRRSGDHWNLVRQERLVRP
jgi:hypothetical protein